MDWNRVEGNWKQVKGKVKEKWGKLTDDDLDVVGGKRDQLEGKIQERYGIARDQVRKDIDHWFGSDLAHSHDGDADHDHDDFVDGPIEDNPLWIADNVTLTSVGIDIGSAGTQVIFSKVHLRRLSEELTSRYYVVGRETLFRSPVALTPYQSEERIDDAKLRAIIDDAYRQACISAKDI